MLQAIARNSVWFIVLFVPVVTGRSNYFGIGFLRSFDNLLYCRSYNYKKRGCIETKEDEGRGHIPKPIAVFLKPISSFKPRSESKFALVPVVTQLVTRG